MYELIKWNMSPCEASLTNRQKQLPSACTCDGRTLLVLRHEVKQYLVPMNAELKERGVRNL